MVRRRYTPPQPWRDYPMRRVPYPQQPVREMCLHERLPVEPVQQATNNTDRINTDTPVTTKIHFTGPDARTQALLYLDRHCRGSDLIKLVICVDTYEKET